MVNNLYQTFQTLTNQKSYLCVRTEHHYALKSIHLNHLQSCMGPVARKPFFEVYTVAILNPVCSATETSYNIEFSNETSLDIWLSINLIVKVLIRLCSCAVWSVLLLLACNKLRVSRYEVHMDPIVLRIDKKSWKLIPQKKRDLKYFENSRLGFIESVHEK